MVRYTNHFRFLSFIFLLSLASSSTETVYFTAPICIRDCYQFDATFLLFLSKETSAEDFLRIEFALLDQIEECRNVKSSFNMEIFSPGSVYRSNQSHLVSCCEYRSCVHAAFSLPYPEALNDKIADEANPNGDTLMFEIALVFAKVKTRGKRSVFLITDHSSLDFQRRSQELRNAYNSSNAAFHVIFLRNETTNDEPIDKLFPGLAVIQIANTSDLLISSCLPQMCIKSSRSSSIVVDDSCGAPGTLPPEGPPQQPPLDLTVFLAFSKFATSDNHMAALLEQVLSTDAMPENPGTVKIFGPRSKLFSICYWRNTLKCINDIMNMSRQFLTIETGPMISNDLEFAPDILNFMRHLALTKNSRRQIFVLIVTDFLSLEMPLNAYFFTEAAARQNLAVTIAVVLEWNNLTTAKVLYEYHPLTPPASVYTLSSFLKLTEIADAVLSAPLSTPNTSWETTLSPRPPPSHPSTFRPSPPTADFPSHSSTAQLPPISATSMVTFNIFVKYSLKTLSTLSSTTSVTETPTTHYSAHQNHDTVIIAVLSQALKEKEIVDVLTFLSENWHDCFEIKRRFLIFFPNTYKTTTEWCVASYCISQQLTKFSNESLIDQYSDDPTQDMLTVAHGFLNSNTVDHFNVTLLLVTDFLSSDLFGAQNGTEHFASSPIFRLDFEIALIASEEEQQIATHSRLNRTLHIFQDFSQLANTTHFFCPSAAKPSDSSPSGSSNHLIIGLAIGISVLSFVFFGLGVIYKNRRLAWETRVLNFRLSRHTQSTEEDSDSLADQKSLFESLKSFASIRRELDVKCLVQAPLDPWEIDRQRVILNQANSLGQGSFGIVYRGSIIGRAPVEFIHRSAFFAYQYENCAVAVKMLPLHLEDRRKEEFMYEMSIMKELGPHPNLVSLLGCITACSPLCMVLEYANKGDLQSFLNGQTLLSMMFLHSKGFIHRDLAARNILLKSGRVVLISDFGLCIRKKKYKYKPCEKLPVKWMAPESLKSMRFSEFSDVWSFGVTLWEMFSMGQSPLDSVKAEDVLAYFYLGKRFPRPIGVIEEVWALMESCWSEVPLHRPNFTRLRQSLGKILEDLSDQSYLAVRRGSEASNFHYKILRNVE